MTATELEPTTAWMQREHPDKLAAARTPHPFDPLPEGECAGGCRRSCICETCWEPKGRRQHRGLRPSVCS